LENQEDNESLSTTKQEIDIAKLRGERGNLKEECWDTRKAVYLIRERETLGETTTGIKKEIRKKTNKRERRRREGAPKLVALKERNIGRGRGAVGQSSHGFRDEGKGRLGGGKIETIRIISRASSCIRGRVTNGRAGRLRE